MKKLIFVASLFVTAFMSASSGINELKKEKKDIERTSETSYVIPASGCIGVGLYIWCTEQMFHDTMCWGPGTGCETYQQAIANEGWNNANLILEVQIHNQVE